MKKHEGVEVQFHKFLNSEIEVMVNFTFRLLYLARKEATVRVRRKTALDTRAGVVVVTKRKIVASSGNRTRLSSPQPVTIQAKLW
jgi:hypothetical protein